MKANRRELIRIGALAATGLISSPAKAWVHGSGGAPTSFAQNAMIDQQVFQRSIASTTGPVAVSGTFSGGTLTGVQSQVLKRSDNSIVIDWTDITNFATGSGTWSGKVANVPQGTIQYYVKTRAKNNVALTSTSSQSFFMGIVILCHGQSNMGTFYGNSNGSFVTLNANCRTFNSNGSNVWDATPVVGPGIAMVVNDLCALTGVSVGAVSGAIGATDIAFLGDNNPGPPGVGVYTGGGALWRLINQIFPVCGVTDSELFLWDQGEADGDEGTPEVTYYGYFNTMRASLCTLFGRTSAQLPSFVFGLTTRGNGSGQVGTDASWAQQRNTQFNLGTTAQNTKFSHHAMDLPRDGGDLHLPGLSNVQVGRRASRTILGAAYGTGTAPSHFEISGGTMVDATHTDVSLALVGAGTDFTPTSGIKGFDVTGNNGATWTAVTGARQTATSIRLTHASLTQTNIRKIRYLYGQNPDVSAPVYDNSIIGTALSPAPFGDVTPVGTPLTYTPYNDITPSGGTTLPRPDYWGLQRDANQTGTMQTITQSIGPAAGAQRMVVLGIAGGAASISSVVVVPNAGTAGGGAGATTLIQNGTGVGLGAIAYCQLDSSANSATSITVTVNYASGPFAPTLVDTWTILSSQLSSTTPVASATNYAASGTSLSLNIATTSGGCVITTARQASNTTPISLTGTETYAVRDIWGFQASIISGDASNVATNASSTITGTYPGSTGAITMAAVSFR